MIHWGSCNMNKRQILGTITILVIIGGTLYAIKKSKDAEKMEESEISLDEARALVAMQKLKGDGPENPEYVQYAKADVEATQEYYERLQNVKTTVGPIKIDGVTTYLEAKPYEEEEYEDDEEPEQESEDFYYIDGDKNPKEDVDLRYDPNSRDARSQFIRMELAEWVPLEDVYQTLLRLFDFPFKPQNDGDDMLLTQIIDYRVRFFGFGSKWNKDITIADVILHYARKAEFNCGESLRYWVNYILEFNELDHTTPSHVIDNMLLRLNSHTYYNEERQTFGLFGLTQDYMDQALKIANLNFDRSVTYEIEFNEFLKSII